MPEATDLPTITKDNFFLQAHNLVAVPDLIALFVAMTLVFLVIGLVFVRESRAKFFLIWFISLVFNTAVLLWFIYLPHSVERLIDFFRTLGSA